MEGIQSTKTKICAYEMKKEDISYTDSWKGLLLIVCKWKIINNFKNL